jgi:hypothetical protein
MLTGSNLTYFCLPRFSPGPSGDSSSLEESANVFMDCSRHQHLELNRSRKNEFCRVKESYDLNPYNSMTLSLPLRKTLRSKKMSNELTKF